MIANKINGKQTKLTWNGKQYKAVVKGRNCQGCAFTGKGGMCPDIPPKDGGRSAHCGKWERVDRQSIVWVERKQQPVQGE